MAVPQALKKRLRDSVQTPVQTRYRTRYNPKTCTESQICTESRTESCTESKSFIIMSVPGVPSIYLTHTYRSRIKALSSTQNRLWGKSRHLDSVHPVQGLKP
jgi:hypothetical protein